MIPIFEEDGVNASLVERRDAPGLFGVAVKGGRFVCPLPAGYDGQTAIAVHNGYVIAAHPSMKPVLCDPTTGKTKVIEPRHASALPGRILLNTK